MVYNVRLKTLSLSLKEGLPEPWRRRLANEPALAAELLRTLFDELEPDSEHTGALYLNARNRVIGWKHHYSGTLDRATVEPRNILRDALLFGAAGFIVAHNHPSGDPTPSREDREFTRRLSVAAEAVGVRLLDHLVIGQRSGPASNAFESRGYVSFREGGLL